MNPCVLGCSFIRGYRRSVGIAAKGRLLGSQWIPQWPTCTAKLLFLLHGHLTVVLSENCQGWDCPLGFYQPPMNVLKRKHMMYTTPYKAKSRSGGRQLLFEPLPTNLSALWHPRKTRAELTLQILSVLLVVSPLSLRPPSTENFLYTSPLPSHAYSMFVRVLD